MVGMGQGILPTIYPLQEQSMGTPSHYVYDHVTGNEGAGEENSWNLQATFIYCYILLYFAHSEYNQLTKQLQNC